MPKRNRIIWAALFVGWMLIGISFSINDYMFREMLGEYFKNLRPGSFWSMLLWDMIYWPTWAMLAPLIFWTARRFPLGHKSWYPNLLITLSTGLVLTLLHRIIYLLIALPIQRAMGEESSFSKLLLYNLPLGFMSYSIILLLKRVADYGVNQKEEARISRLQADLTQEQLQVLKMQLQPHFIFNTLSSISALLHEDVKAADKMLARLGDFLRLTTSEKQIVTLEEELHCTRQYLEIEEVRLEDRLQVSYEIEPQTLAAQVPNLILQPIIENAIKHGVNQSLAQARIVISAKLDQGKLYLRIKDNGDGWQGNGDGYQERVGIKNTRDRLKSVYDAAARFDLRRTPDGWTYAILELPFIPASEKLGVANGQ
jgi:sensor histidine kinase YesM